MLTTKLLNIATNYKKTLFAVDVTGNLGICQKYLNNVKEIIDYYRYDYNKSGNIANVCSVEFIVSEPENIFNFVDFANHFKGGGGSDYKQVIDKAIEENYDCLVLFGDGVTVWPEHLEIGPIKELMIVYYHYGNCPYPPGINYVFESTLDLNTPTTKSNNKAKAESLV